MMMLLGTKDESKVAYLDGAIGRIGNKYTHNAIHKNVFFSKMADEYNNITNKEQLSFCIRTVDYNLEVKEDFLASMS